MTVPVPAETGVEDRLAGSLTFRHAAYLAVAAAGVAVMLLGERNLAGVVVGALLAFAGLAGAAVRPYGEPLDRLLPAALAYRRRRRAERRAERRAMAAAAAEAAAEAESATPAQAVAEPPVAVGTEEPRVRAPRRVPLRPLVLAAAFAAVVAVAVARWPHPAPPPPPQVVVVPVPVQVVDPWEEVIDDAVDAWLDDVAGS